MLHHGAMWTELLQTHGYWILAIGCLLEGEAVLVLAGFAAHRGLLDPAVVVCIAAVGWMFGAAVETLLGELRHLEGWLFLALGLVLGVWALARRRIVRRRGVG